MLPDSPQSIDAKDGIAFRSTGITSMTPFSKVMDAPMALRQRMVARMSSDPEVQKIRHGFSEKAAQMSIRWA